MTTTDKRPEEQKLWERSLIRQIARRASDYGNRVGRPIEIIEVGIAVHAVHNGGTPLRLDDLLKAPELDFIHEIGGILAHANEDGSIRGNFVPRFRA